MATITDIAHHARVSRCTASQVLNGARGHERFSGEVRDRVLAAARVLGWSRDQRGMALRTGSAGALVLGLTWHGQASGLQRSVLTAVEEAARKRGLHLLVVGGGGVAAARAVEEHRADGALVLGWGLGEADRRALSGCRHSVLLHVPAGMPGADVDLRAGVSAAVRHLAELGHRRAAWIDMRGNFGADERFSSCARACLREKIDLRRVTLRSSGAVDEPATVAATCAGVVQARPLLGGCTALICFNDLIALGVYAAAAESGLRIGVDWSVVGCDDVHAALAIPPLTTISHECEAVALAAVDALGDAGGGRIRRITPRLCIRQSTRPPPG